MNLFEFYLLLFGIIIPTAAKYIWTIKYKLIIIALVIAGICHWFDFKYGWNSRFKE